MILLTFLYLQLFQNKKLKVSLLKTDPFHLVPLLLFLVEDIRSIVVEKLERMGWGTIINPYIYLGAYCMQDTVLDTVADSKRLKTQSLP